jgi:tRNA 2-thiouridine synthesizing protein E
MTNQQTTDAESTFDPDGFLKVMSDWNRSMVEELAEKHDIGPLTGDHWKVIEYVKGYYETYGTGPPVVRIGKITGLSSKEICRLFPCGTVKGAYRLAGLPRPAGCAG